MLMWLNSYHLQVTDADSINRQLSLRVDPETFTKYSTTELQHALQAKPVTDENADGEEEENKVDMIDDGETKPTYNPTHFVRDFG